MFRRTPDKRLEGCEVEVRNCNSFRCDAKCPNLARLLASLQWSMMYDDAHAAWGHRDNILRESHRAVNIGIAFNGRLFTLVQHFEGGAVEASTPPSLSRDGTLSFATFRRGWPE